MRYVNGPESKEVDDALEKLYSDVSLRTNYSPRFDALPFNFANRNYTEAHVRSLKFHAEKKALATLLLKNSEKLSMRVNIKCCADCHSFLTFASAMLKREICVLEPTRSHSFQYGKCSCGLTTNEYDD